ncbi:MAG: hypothetical protein HYT19_00455 [Candidatus Nealsonbacteria bacterium]|nr:hypothetical protein [Candidatus Nealsonbacteria bacterium]
MLHKEYYHKNKAGVSQYHKKWYKNNKEKLLKYSEIYYQKNTEKIRQRHRLYNQKNKRKILKYKGEWQRHKAKTDPKYRLDQNMGTALWNSLKNKKAGKNWEIFVNYTLENLVKHLEKQFNNKMNWSNYGSYWAVDHIKPRSLFNYSSPNDLGFKQCWDLKNLQPLEKIKNIIKGNRYIN